MRLRPTPPVYHRMSKNSISPSHNQSHPNKPPGATMMYMIVVQGRNMMPSIGQIHHRLPPAKFRKADSQRSGWKIHHNAPKIRGPRITSVRNAQHMVRSPYMLFCEDASPSSLGMSTAGQPEGWSRSGTGCVPIDRAAWPFGPQTPLR